MTKMIDPICQSEFIVNWHKQSRCGRCMTMGVTYVSGLAYGGHNVLGLIKRDGKWTIIPSHCISGDPEQLSQLLDRKGGD